MVRKEGGEGMEVMENTQGLCYSVCLLLGCVVCVCHQMIWTMHPHSVDVQCEKCTFSICGHIVLMCHVGCVATQY